MTLDQRAQQRLYVLNHVLAGELSATEAAGYLQVSLRTVRRLLARYRGDEVAAALVHWQPRRARARRAAGRAGHPRGLDAVQRWGDSEANRIAAEGFAAWDTTLTLENLVVDTTTQPTQVVVNVAGSSAPQETETRADPLASSLEEPVLLRIRSRPESIAGEIAVD